MSLLNDALRAAEQRQNRPEVASAYAGHSQPRGHRRSGVWILVLLLGAGLIGASVFWFMTRGGSDDMPARISAEPAPETVSEPKPDAGAGNKNNRIDSQLEDTVQVVNEPVVSAAGREPVSAQPQTPAPEVVARPETKPDEAVEVPETEPVSEVVARPETAAGETEVTENRPDQATEAPAPPVKQVRETPEAVDRRTSRELASLLRSGETREAEQRLKQLAAIQTAAASREVFARQMIVQGMPERALAWLPEPIAENHMELRLLRARALHSVGNLQAALTVLEHDVPAVSQSAEYRITLATLLQQAGRNTDAARHWSALIAEDDSRAAWWVGLAIALETGGEINSAVRAYSQAAQLPGLSPSLADYVRERLKSLQAG